MRPLLLPDPKQQGSRLRIRMSRTCLHMLQMYIKPWLGLAIIHGFRRLFHRKQLALTVHKMSKVVDILYHSSI
jgi:hypothetical protein